MSDRFPVEEQVKLLEPLKPGDAFEYGVPFAGLTNEKITWMVMESQHGVVQLQGYLFDTPVARAKANIFMGPDGKQTVQWRFL